MHFPRCSAIFGKKDTRKVESARQEQGELKE